jgi:hypothetical protein
VHLKPPWLLGRQSGLGLVIDRIAEYGRRKICGAFLAIQRASQCGAMTVRPKKA